MKKTLNILIFIAFSLFSVFFFFSLSLKLNYPLIYSNEFNRASKESGVDLNLLYSIAKTESNFNPNRISSVGAIGIMQLMPETAKFVCEKNGTEFKEEFLLDPEFNILVGAKYFRYLLDKFKNTETSLAAYNAGEGNVSKWLKCESYSDDGTTLKNIPFKETKQYVEKVNNNFEIYKKIKK